MRKNRYYIGHRTKASKTKNTTQKIIQLSNIYIPLKSVLVWNWINFQLYMTHW